MQVNENVNASNLLTVGNVTGKNNSQKSNDNSTQTDFASFLSPVISDASKQNGGVEQSDVKNSVKSKSDSTTKTDASSAKTDNGTDKVSTKGKDEKKSVDNNTDDLITSDKAVAQVVNSPEQEDVSVQDELTDGDLDALFQVLSNILQNVTEQLDVSMEDLNVTLQDLDMDVSDLLSEGGMKDLFLSVNDAEVSDLLVNEDLNVEWNQFEEQMNSLLEEVDFPVEQLQTAAETMDVVSVMEAGTAFVEEKTDITSENVIRDVDLPFKEDVEEPVLNEVVVSVEDDRPKTDTYTEQGKESFEQQTFTDTSKESSKVADSKNSTSVKTESFENPILQALENAVDNVEDIQPLEEIPISGREIIDQVVEQIRVNMNQDTTSMEMQLYPEHLGKIQINVVSKDGVMTAKIVAETEAAKQAIEGGLTNLKESMEHQNLKVDAIEVMVSTAGFERNNDEQAAYEEKNSSRSGRRVKLSDLEDEEEQDETAELEKMKYAGSSVSYTA
jgi:flagellar hook-length control protein FliK